MTTKISGSTGITMPDGTTSASVGRARIVDQKASGTSAGTSSAATTQTRSLNTIILNDIGMTNPADGQFVLQPGTYLIEAEAPALNSGNHKAFIATTAAQTVPADPSLVGTSAYSYDSASTASLTMSKIKGRITVATATAFCLRHYTSTSQATSGLGAATGLGASFPEVYSTVDITKEK